MPRRKGEPDIPGTLARSDEHAQHIYTKTHDSAVEQYGEGEIAHRVAFDSVKHSYRKVGDHWEKKARRGPSGPQAARTTNTSPSSTDPPAPTAGGEVMGMEKSKDELYGEAKDLDIPGRSKMGKEELAEAIQAERAKQ